jgi:acyl dehydratase
VFEKEVTFTPRQVEAFADSTGDANPIHRQGRRDKQVVPGLLCSSLFPAIIGTQFPGSLYLEQSLHFKQKVYAGETVRARLVVEHLESRRKVTFSTQCVLIKKLNKAEQEDSSLRDKDAPVVVTGKAKALIR